MNVSKWASVKSTSSTSIWVRTQSRTSPRFTAAPPCQADVPQPTSDGCDPNTSYCPSTPEHDKCCHSQHKHPSEHQPSVSDRQAPASDEPSGFPQHDERLRVDAGHHARSEEHTSELQSRENLVCRLLLEKK